MYGLAGDLKHLTWSVSRKSMFQPPTSRQNQHVMDLAKEDTSLADNNIWKSGPPPQHLLGTVPPMMFGLPRST